MSCRRHGTFRHDRVPRMVDFFAQHSVAGCRCGLTAIMQEATGLFIPCRMSWPSKCHGPSDLMGLLRGRPEWAPLAQQPGESRAACEERLRSVFPFSSAAPLPGPLRFAAAAHQLQADSVARPRAEPDKTSLVAAKGKPACKQPVGQRSGAGANSSLLAVPERQNKGQAPRACGSTAAGTQPALQQQRLLSIATKPTSKQASAPTRPGPKRDGKCLVPAPLGRLALVLHSFPCPY